MTDIRVLIVDDEPLARAKIRSLLADEPDVQVVGEAANGEDAVSAIEAEKPDLVFLDVQMPEMDGFGVIEAVGADRMPLVIFATAYDEYALQAFDVCALDYVTKPIDRDRFADAVRRAKARLSTPAAPDGGTQLRPLVDHLARQQQRNARLAIKTEGRTIFLRTAEIDWVEAVDNYAKLHVGKETFTVRDTLARLEHRLPAGRFLRVHRSTIVNVDRVREIQPWFQGDWVLILQDGTRLTTGRSYRQRLQAFIDEMS
jgi:two-component system LytT family response regulator